MSEDHSRPSVFGKIVFGKTFGLSEPRFLFFCLFMNFLSISDSCTPLSAIK